MDLAFWQNKWAQGDIGFHQSEVNPVLEQYLDKLAVEPGGRIFVPLCGKTLDIAWLLGNGYQVVGAELILEAIEALFAALDVTPQVEEFGVLTRYRAEGLEIWGGDIFHLTEALLGDVDGVYDRAALVALPPTTRTAYTSHLVRICRGAPQLLVTFEYEQAKLDGPPFAVLSSEVSTHYEAHYDLQLLEQSPMPGGLKGLVPASSNAWLLRNVR